MSGDVYFNRLSRKKHVPREEKGMEQLKELLAIFEERLELIRKTIAEFDEGMDYATHCSLQGFAEALEYVVEEIRNRLS
ncbi:MAG: hypothetical protein A4E57_02412 [Syntrophorhabdaceae bacterium PtaU1.Bin034]|nr:MAG: hypothetical protein A4E57_02412 [Syntrophorhabdaceae bacterium PtaU1.Bin034]